MPGITEIYSYLINMKKGINENNIRNGQNHAVNYSSI